MAWRFCAVNSGFVRASPWQVKPSGTRFVRIRSAGANAVDGSTWSRCVMPPRIRYLVECGGSGQARDILHTMVKNYT